MATLVLAAAGAAIGGAVGGTAFGLSTAVIGRAVGATLGRVVDQRLMGGGSEVIETGRLERFRLTGASEGSAINRVYGRMRVGGQVIWASKFLEKSKTSTVGGKGGGGGTSTKRYRYSISLAVALCEGEILRLGRIWADGIEIGRGKLTLRVYTGAQDQLPDPKIEAVEGAGNAPAYRGLAYVVFEDLKLDSFGNRVPQFSFEVIRATASEHVPETARSLSEIVGAVAMIPGTGEYGLATTPVEYANGLGWNASANVNSPSGKTDFATSLEHLTEELPNCQSVSLVVSWFGDDLRCGSCSVRPKVEQKGTDGNRMPWQVSGLVRDDAETVPKQDGRAVYGGTPSDQSVVEAIRALRAEGKDVLFYPFILMEQMEGNSLPDPWTGAAGQNALPWRGRITTSLAPGMPGSPDRTSAAAVEVQGFFGDAASAEFVPGTLSVDYTGQAGWSFRRFILHYAHLCALAGGVDAFCIGSEMRSLTQVRGAGDTFPAVEELRRLAADVRVILGPDTKISYAADWSEYFGYRPKDSPEDVYFHLDPLWADPDIDFIGIDNYMPISDWRDGRDHADAHWGSIYNLGYLRSNIAGGEGFDWFYADAAGRDAQIRLPITDGAHAEPWVFRYKDILNWWRNRHHERVGGVRNVVSTTWVPESKPIWFTELGCAAIDKGTNQPNKFLDPKSSESTAPHYSASTRDDLIQAQYLRAMHLQWRDVACNPISSVYGAPMVNMDRAHVWAWDVRPFPSFPANSGLWSDGENYFRGHWLNGRTTSESLAAVVSEICARSGVENVDVSSLHGIVHGYAIEAVSGARAALQPLMLAHGFDASEWEGRLHFRTRSGAPDREIQADRLAVTSELDGRVEKTRAPQAEVSGRVRLNYVQTAGDFETRASEAVFPDDVDVGVSSSEIPMSLTAAEAQRIVDRWLVEARAARDTIRFAVPPSDHDITAGDVIRLARETEKGLFRVDRIDVGEALTVDAVRVEPDIYLPAADLSDDLRARPFLPAMPVFPVMMDLPLLSGKEDPASPHLAVSARPWPGSVAIYASSEDDGYDLSTVVEARASIGVTEGPLPRALPGVLDRGAPLRVRFGSGTPSSASVTSILDGANVAAIGDPASGRWEVFQYANATLVDTDTYELGTRLRGQAGTDGVMPDAWPTGSIVVLLDGAPEQIGMTDAMRGLERHYRIGPAAQPYDDVSFTHIVAAFEGVGLRPYVPAHLRASADPNGDVVFAWMRRTRTDGDSWQAFEVPLGEDRELYLIRVEAAGTVLREEIVSSPSWTYSLADRQFDGCTGAFRLGVAQISDRFGPGPFRSLDINE